MLPIAVDAMGGDHAPNTIVEGCIRANVEHGIPVILVGRPEDLPDTGGLEVIAASEVIAMDAEAGSSVRRMKDSSLVRGAESVRDGVASAFFSAGNTGATMASALLRMGRIKGVARPAIATPIPTPTGTPCTLLDAGANAECSPEWLVQFAQMGAIYARARYNTAVPKVGLLSIGEEPTKGNDLVKATHKLLAELDWAAVGAEWVGNVEGRDVMDPDLDVVVTDGFTGNVVLKTLEGGLGTLINSLLEVFGSTPEAQAAAETLMPAMAPLYERFNAESVGSAMLLGVDGVCLIGHGSSSADAVVNGLIQGAELVKADLVANIAAAIRP